MRKSLLLCYRAVSAPHRVHITTQLTSERLIPTSARSNKAFLLLELYSNNLKTLIKNITENRPTSLYSFGKALEHAPHILRCSRSDIWQAYGLEHSVRIMTNDRTLDFWFLSKEKKIEILRDLKKDAEQLSQTLCGKPRSFKTALNKTIKSSHITSPSIHPALRK